MRRGLLSHTTVQMRTLLEYLTHSSFLVCITIDEMQHCMEVIFMTKCTVLVLAI